MREKEYSVGNVLYIIENFYEIEDSVEVGGDDKHLSFIDVKRAIHHSHLLTDKEKIFVDYWSKGFDWFELKELCGMSKSSVYNWQKRIPRKIANFLNGE